MNRRSFFKKSASVGAVGATALLIPEIVNAAITESNAVNAKKCSFKTGQTILFQGDSITDCGRNRDKENIANDQSQIGLGYSLFASANILANNPSKDLKIFNRGISGNKVFELNNRWEKDCLNLKPDVLSILIGVNDYWHTLDWGYKGTIEIYENDYRNLIKRTKEALPDVQIVICEPFIIHGGRNLNDSWEADIALYRDAARRIAKDFNLIFVPFQSVFNKALEKAPASYWGEDGVHPSMAGAQLMAQAWLKATT